MRDNVFLENKKELELADFMNYADGSRGNLGKDIPVTIYRLLEYSIREQLIRQFGKETQIQVFQDAGFRAEIKVQLMEDKNCELLFEYLRSILYDKEIQTLDITKLDEPYQKLGRGLQVLERTVEEMLEYSKDLSVGNWKKYRKV